MSVSHTLALAVLVCACARAEDGGLATLKPSLQVKFDAYVRETEARIDREVHSSTYLWCAQDPERLARVRRGETVIEPVHGKGDIHVGDGIIHDWTGALFIPGVTLDRAVAFLQDYGIHRYFYRPEVIESRLISRNGNEAHVFYRFRKRVIVTVAMDTEHVAHFYPLSKTRWYSASRTTRIAELKNFGKPTEHELPPGRDHGFLWRLNTYWRIEEKDGGVYMESETISLTREVAWGLGWLINPIIRALPAESLAHILTATREGILLGPEAHLLK
jgi:hypothetical protein